MSILEKKEYLKEVIYFLGEIGDGGKIGENVQYLDLSDGYLSVYLHPVY